jgi:two-component system CheB/CheR fusion protein
MGKNSTGEAADSQPVGTGARTRKAATRPSPNPSQPDSRAMIGCPIVVIGASAGGLEAMARLLDVMPGNMGMAFLLVQHLDPHHDSQLAELLTRHSPMPIREASEGMAINPNEIYTCPPGYFMSVRFGVLHLSRADRGRPYPASD